MKITKSMILPIVTILFMAVEGISGHKVTNVTVDEVSNASLVLITAAISIWGVWKNHHKRGQ